MRSAFWFEENVCFFQINSKHNKVADETFCDHDGNTKDSQFRTLSFDTAKKVTKIYIK